VTIEAGPTKVIDGVTLRRDPAREPCFTVVDTDAEMQDWPAHIATEIGGAEGIAGAGARAAMSNATPPVPLQ